MVPRPGLSAAVVAVKLDHLIRRELDLLLLMSQFWSGSQIVIGYIRNETSGLMHMLLTAHLKFKRTTPVAFCPWRQRCHVTGAQKICRISEGMVRNFVGLLVQQAPIWCRNWNYPRWSWYLQANIGCSRMCCAYRCIRQHAWTSDVRPNGLLRELLPNAESGVIAMWIHEIP